MATQKNGPEVTFTIGETIASAFLLVKLEIGSGEAILTEGSSGADVRVLGPVQEAYANGDAGRVRMLNCVPEAKVVCDGTAQIGVAAYTGAAGKATAVTTSGMRIGFFKDDGDADGDIVRVIPNFANDVVSAS